MEPRSDAKELTLEGTGWGVGNRGWGEETLEIVKVDKGQGMLQILFS